MEQFEVSDSVVGGGGLALIIASILPWYSWNIMGVHTGGSGAGYGWICFVLGLGVIVWMVLNVFEVINVELPFSQGVLYLGAGILSALIAVLRLLFRPGGFGVTAGPHIGIFVAIIGAAAVIVGGVMKLQQDV